MSIFHQYFKKCRYIDNRYRYFIIKQEKVLLLLTKMDFSLQKSLSILISISFFSEIPISISILILIFSGMSSSISISIFSKMSNIDINIFNNGLIDINIFKNGHIDMDIFKKCRYIDNRYDLSIYRTPPMTTLT